MVENSVDRVFEMDDLRRAGAATQDGHHVNPPIAIQIGMCLEKVLRRGQQMRLFANRHGFLRTTECARGARLDLDKDGH